MYGINHRNPEPWFQQAHSSQNATDVPTGGGGACLRFLHAGVGFIFFLLIQRWVKLIFNNFLSKSSKSPPMINNEWSLSTVMGMDLTLTTTFKENPMTVLPFLQTGKEKAMPTCL